MQGYFKVIGICLGVVGAIEVIGWISAKREAQERLNRKDRYNDWNQQLDRQFEIVSKQCEEMNARQNHQPEQAAV